MPRPLQSFATAAGCRYFEKINPEANERKFWALQFVDSRTRPGGVALLLRWGRIGTEGDSKPFEFIDDDACLRAAALRTSKKLAEGYREILTESDDASVIEDELLPPPTDAAGFRIDKAGVRIRNGDGWALDVRGRAVRRDEERRKDEATATLGDLVARFREPAKPVARPVAKLAEDRQIDFEE